MKIRIDKMVLSSEHSIIELPRVREESETLLKQHFGLSKIEHSSFEDLSPEKMTGNDKYKLKPEDIVRVPFRALSATIVAGGTWRATDFSNEKVLKDAIPLLVGKPAYQDHSQWGNSFIGSIETGTWGKKQENFPAGINVVYQIDGKNNPKLAAGLLMEPPAIHSNSVTVEFEWVPSHDFETENEFYNNVGKIINGKMVTRVVTKILNFYESSILWMGADPYAKMLDKDGKPMMPDKGSAYDDMTAYTKEVYESEKKYFVSCSFGKEHISLTHSLEKNQSNNNNKMKEELKKAIQLALKLDENVEITKEHLAKVKLGLSATGEFEVITLTEEEILTSGKVESLTREVEELKNNDSTKALRELNKTLTTENAALQSANDRLELEVKNNEKLVELGKTYQSKKVAEAIDLYKKSVGEDKADASVIDLFSKADNEAIDGLLKQYAKGVAERFSAKCVKCGATDMEFRSSLHIGGESKEHDENYRENFKDKF